MTRPTDAGYLPFDGRPFRLRMGTRPLAIDRWLEIDEHRSEDLALKGELTEHRLDDVVAVLDDPRVVDAATELEEEIVRWLEDHEIPVDPIDDRRHPIARCGLMTQEDWCVLVELDGPPPVLAAASVCFPTRWRLREKLGLTTAAIHAPVAFYDDQLAAPVDSFLDRLRVSEPKWRLNWNLVDDGALHQPERRPAPDIGPDEVADRVWLRVERQTFRRLPRTGAVVFSIRIHQQPLASMAANTEVLSRLRAAVDALPEPTFDYKGLAPFAASLRAWIEAPHIET